MNNGMKIARRYALAFFNVFPLTQKDYEKLREAVTFLEDNPQISAFLKIPALEGSIKYQALEEHIIKRFDLPASCNQLLRVVVSKKRAELLLEILRALVRRYQQQHNMLMFCVESSVPLVDEQQEAVRQFLARQTGAFVVSEFEIDEQLIAGIRMQSDELKWEYSIARQLQDLKCFDELSTNGLSSVRSE